MSDGYRGASQPTKKAKAGSVRAARERLEAGIQDVPQQPTNTSNRGPPPQRPPRPSYVPSILDSTKVNEQMSTIPYEQPQDPRGGPVQQQAKYWEPNYILSPQAPSTPGTGISSSSSRDSTGSSVGSIPDFPVPALPANPPPPLQFRRNGNLGPPPSARRGASSYYSQSSYVAPIPEEAWEPASPGRGALPRKRRDRSEWTEENSDYYGTRLDDEDLDDRDSRSTDPDESTGLVRKASLGKQYKPSLTTVRSSRETSSTKQGSLTDGGRQGTESIPVMLDDGPNSSFLRGPSEESEESKEILMDEKGVPRFDSKSPKKAVVDPQVEIIMGGLEKGGALKSGTMAPFVTSREGSPPLHRPPPLDIDGPRQGEVRSSLTSLTDLIRRATKVAANLEKGRTASRLGMLDMFSSSNPNLLNRGANEQPRRTSVSDMLNSFPAPALGTPTRSPRPDSRSRWPSPFANSNFHYPQSPGPELQKRRQGRRCCGMPLWVFLLLLVILLILIAAAVVIPIVLIVLPRQNQSAQPSDPLANCPASNPCSNGGTSLISSDSCRCICTNGFTGSNCTNAATGSSGCTSTDVGDFKSATLGTSIPRLFTGASPNFSIPLNTTALLSDFSFNQMACSDENNLVSFSGVQQRRDLPHPVREYVALLPRVTLAPRIAEPEPQSPGVVSVDSIIFNGAGPTSTAPNLATTAGPTPTPTSTSAMNSPNSTQIDFAGVAMLYIFQQTSLSNAVSAKNSLQNAFSSGSFAGPVLVTSNITVDVDLFRVSIAGSTVGRKEQ